MGVRLEPSMQEAHETTRTRMHPFRLTWLKKISSWVGRSHRPGRKLKVRPRKHAQDEVMAQRRSCAARQATACCTMRFISWTSMSCGSSMRSDCTRPKADTTAAGMSAKFAARTSVEASAGHASQADCAVCNASGAHSTKAASCSNVVLAAVPEDAAPRAKASRMSKQPTAAAARELRRGRLAAGAFSTMNRKKTIENLRRIFVFSRANEYQHERNFNTSQPTPS